nr:MBL fold metallo-hydrolase [Halomicronema hongdechloris]
MWPSRCILSGTEIVIPPPADWVFCSHAHPDHARGLLSLHQQFPEIPIYGSEVTVHLLPSNWPNQAEANTSFCQALPWRTPIEIAQGLTVQLWPAGHLPGAACLLLRYTTPQRTYSVLYTGDFFLSNSRLVEGLPLEELRGLKPDVLLLEGTYGTARYPHRRHQENRIAEQINRVLAQGKGVILPTPALGLGQELLMLLRSHHHFTGQDFTVWVDPIVAAGCDLYLELLPYFPSSVQNFARHQSLFWDERILPRVRRLDAIPKAVQPPCIIIGHQAEDLSRYCSSIKDWVLFLAATESAVSDGSSANQASSVSSVGWLQKLAAQTKRDQVSIATYLLTTHSDGISTTQLIHNLRPQHVVFVHGVRHQLADLTNLDELQSRYQLHLPSPGQLVELPIGDRFVQPAAPDVVYEGELTADDNADDEDGAITVSLPGRLSLDPRWSKFADTGVIQAKWQGDDILLHGLSQHELLSQPGQMRDTTIDCCFNCLHLRGQRCSNPASPLYGFKVTPDGYCPAFEPIAGARMPSEGEDV